MSSFAGTLARPHTAVAGLQGAAWALRTSVYLLPQLSQINPCPARQLHGVCSRDGRRAVPGAGTPAHPGRDLPGRCGSRPVRAGYTRKVQLSRLRVCGRARGTPLTCKHTRGKGDPQHRRPDGHFLGHAEEGHFGAGSERRGSRERRGPARLRAEWSKALRSARPGRAGPRCPWWRPHGTWGHLGGSYGPRAPACPKPGAAGVARGWVTRWRCAPSSR